MHRNGYIFVHLQNSIYKFNVNSTGIYENSSKSSAITMPKFDIDGNSSMILAYDSTTIIVYDILLNPVANFTTSNSFNFTANITNVKFVRYPYIAILTNDNILKEFDYF